MILQESLGSALEKKAKLMLIYIHIIQDTKEPHSRAARHSRRRKRKSFKRAVSGYARVSKSILRVQHDPHAARTTLGIASTNYIIINISVNAKQTVQLLSYR